MISQDTVDWHRLAAERDGAYLALGPVDDTETTEGPWSGASLNEDDEDDEEEEPHVCVDCGVDTTPCQAPLWTPCSPEFGCAHDGTWEWYMLTDEIWAEIGEPACACIGCVEKRLGRPLVASDFADLPINEPNRYDTPRLVAARAREMCS